jgi:hypothetical protein
VLSPKYWARQISQEAAWHQIGVTGRGSASDTVRTARVSEWASYRNPRYEPPSTSHGIVTVLLADHPGIRLIDQDE